MGPLGTAIIGTGFIGPVHVEGVRRLGHRVIGVLGSSPERSQAAAHPGIGPGSPTRRRGPTHVEHRPLVRKQKRGNEEQRWKRPSGRKPVRRWARRRK